MRYRASRHWVQSIDLYDEWYCTVRKASVASAAWTCCADLEDIGKKFLDIWSMTIPETLFMFCESRWTSTQINNFPQRQWNTCTAQNPKWTLRDHPQCNAVGNEPKCISLQWLALLSTRDCDLMDVTSISWQESLSEWSDKLLKANNFF